MKKPQQAPNNRNNSVLKEPEFSFTYFFDCLSHFPGQCQNQLAGKRTSKFKRQVGYKQISDSQNFKFGGAI